MNTKGQLGHISEAIVAGGLFLLLLALLTLWHGNLGTFIGSLFSSISRLNTASSWGTYTTSSTSSTGRDAFTGDVNWDSSSFHGGGGGGFS